MKVYRGLKSIDPPLSGATLTIGNFDGVHRGHQQILAQARMSASRTGGSAVAMTFDPHPLTLTRPQAESRLLTPMEARLELIAAGGMRATVVLETDRELLALSPEQFVEQVVVARFGPRAVVEGESWRFGRGRSGDVNTLRALGGQYGFEVSVVPTLTIQLDRGEDVLVSSTLIRRFLGEGHVDRAAACLGRPYAMLGRVVGGQRRGRDIGFPTANIDITEQLIPADGVYAGKALVGDRWFAAGVSIGPAPTFGRTDSTVEAHLLDFEGRLYDESIRIELLRWIRAQQTFETPEQLQRQIERDLRHVRAVVKAAG